jgi:sec-independent protein translocase protein TatC
LGRAPLEQTRPTDEARFATSAARIAARQHDEGRQLTMARALKRPNVRLKVPNLKVPRLPDATEPDVFEEMSLYEHLDELRSRIVKACISIGAAFVIGIILARPLLDYIKEGANTDGFDVVSPTDPITLYFKVALYIAVIIALPMILYQLIAFLSPGLTKKEKRLLYSALPFVSILFLVGASYAFFFAAPRALTFLSNFLSDLFEWSPEGIQVINFYLTLMIGLGFAFQMPVIMFVLAKLNLVSAKKMGQYRKYAFLGILVLSAVITPSTDPVNLAIVAVPLVLLYEVGIMVARVFAKTSVNGEVVGA